MTKLIICSISYWNRCIKTAGPGVQARFKEHLGMFFEAINKEASGRDQGIIPDLEWYIDIRRDTCGCKPVFDLIEYALDIDLPDHVIDHPVIKALNQGSNDLVTWSNVSSKVKLFVCNMLIVSAFYRIYFRTTWNRRAETRTI